MTQSLDPISDGMNRRTALTLMVRAGAAIAMNASVLSTARAQTAPPVTYAADVKAELKQIAPNVYAYLQREGPGQSNLSISNCGFVAGGDSLFAIDATSAPIQAKRFIAAANQATGKRFKRLVITHHHSDHIGGIQFFEGADVVAHEQCRAMMAKLIGQPKPASWAARPNWADGTEQFKLTLPNETYSDRITYSDYGDTPVELFFPGRSHTTGDTLVHLPRQKIIFLGDIGFFGVTPLNGSGYLEGWIKVCDMILGMDVETIVPGHGPVAGKAELAEMRDYLILMWREGRKRFDAGMSAGRAAADIDLGKYQTWADADRIANNVARLYSEFKGTITPDLDRDAAVAARDEYYALKTRR